MSTTEHAEDPVSYEERLNKAKWYYDQGHKIADKDDLALETAGNSFRRGTEVLLRGLIEASGFELQEVNLWNDIAEDRTPSKLIENPDYHSCELFLNSLGLIEETESDNIETIRKFGNPASHGQERASDRIQDEDMQKMISAANELYVYANDYENHAEDLREKAVGARRKVFSGILKSSFQTAHLEKQIFRYEQKDNSSERDKKSLQRLRKKTELMNELQVRYYRRLKKESPKKARSIAVAATTKSMNELLDEFDNTVSYASRKKDGIENKQQYLSRNFLDAKARDQLKEIEKDLSGAEAQLDAIGSSIMAKLDKLDSLAGEGAAWELRTEASKHAAKAGYRQYNFGGEPLSKFWLFKQWYSRLSGTEQGAFVLGAFCLLSIPCMFIRILFGI